MKIEYVSINTYNPRCFRNFILSVTEKVLLAKHLKTRGSKAISQIDEVFVLRAFPGDEATFRAL